MSRSAVSALVLGILGFVLCPFVLSIVAWIVGASEIDAIRHGRSPAGGEGFARAGMVLGIVGVVYILVLASAVAAIVLLTGSLFPWLRGFSGFL